MRLTAFSNTPAILRLAATFAGALGLASAAAAQQAPQVLPFTMSTYAGGHAAYTAGAACSNGIGVALDTQGDGCLATSVSGGIDIHDVRVDGRGNVYYIDNSTVGLIHKINGETGLQTIFVGSPSSSKTCASSVDTYGDGCPANDGAANNTTANPFTSSKFKSQRGLAVAPNGDVFSAGYNDYNIHKVSAATGLFTLVAGIAATTTATTTANTGTAVGTAIGSSRGVGVDAAGNVYIADTGANVIQMVNTSGVMSLVTAANPTPTKVVTNAIPANTALVSAPEDVQVDSNGNIVIADTGNAVIRAIYSGKGAFFGITAPQTGYIYTIAGGGTGTYAPGTGLISTAVPGTSIALSGVRKLGLDAQGNIYLGDTVNGYIWFIDVNTGYIRLMVGNFGATPGSSAVGCTASPTVSGTYNYGDGCPGVQATLYGNSTNASISASADNQGNIYITDPQFANGANSRIRKLLSGLNFPATASAATATQQLDIHTGLADTVASLAVATGDFTVSACSTTVNADTTTDCVVTVTFKPTKPGLDTALLSITTTLGGKTTYLLTGTGTATNVSLDPGALTLTSSNTSAPQGVAYDGTGNTYVADTGNNRILRVTTAGVVTTFAGTGTAGNSGDAGLATAATLRAPRAVAFGTGGVIYIADTGNNTIRQVNLLTGIITTVAGGASTVCSTASNTLGDSCLATAAKLSRPTGITVDKLGQLYIADSGDNVIRQISVSGYIYTLAGGATTICTTGFTDTLGDGCAALSAIFSNPTALAYDQPVNALIVADTANNVVRRLSLGSTITVTGTNIGTALINPVSLIAGNGQAGSTVDTSGVATNSQLNLPTGVAIDSGENVYIADTGNHAVRLVHPNGTIATIAGILGTLGATTPGVATDTLLSSPSSVAVLPSGLLYIADAGNNRILADARSAVSYNFGRVQPTVTSPAEIFTLSSTGNTSAIFGSSVVSYLSGGGQAAFSLAPSSTGGCVASTGTASTLAPGAFCNVTATFTPPAVGAYAANYSVNIAQGPSIALSGTGALLTTTTSVVAQTSPTTGNAQYGGSLTLGVTVTPSSCNTAAPSCYPTGTVRISVDGTQSSPQTLSATATASQIFTGLAVGPHTVTCSYSGDGFYAASSCGTVTITIAAATTTSTLTATNNGVAQFPSNNCTYNATTALTTCVATTLTATVVSSTIGIPTGSVTFYATPTGSSTIRTLGTASVNASTGIATFQSSYILNADGSLSSDNTLAPGTYSLSCTYTPTAGTTSNFATSNCAAISFTVAADAQGITLVTKGCSTLATASSVTGTPSQARNCPAPTFVGTVPSVNTAQGSTTDAAVFITPANTVSGTLTYSCSGLPQYSTCTFSPTSVTLAASTSYVSPIPVDVTLWTDVKDAALTTPNLPGHTGNGVQFASLTNRFGWPLALLGFAGLFAARRRFRNLRVLAALLLLVGTSMVATGCAGPGNYTPNLTPAGSYPVTITVKSTSGATASTQVYFVVSAPGIKGIQ